MPDTGHGGRKDGVLTETKLHIQKKKKWLKKNSWGTVELEQASLTLLSTAFNVSTTVQFQLSPCPVQSLYGSSVYLVLFSSYESALQTYPGAPGRMSESHSCIEKALLYTEEISLLQTGGLLHTYQPGVEARKNEAELTIRKEYSY